MQFIDELRAKILLNRRDSAAYPYIFLFCNILCTLQGGVDSVGNKLERCSSFHLDGFPWMVRQHKRRYVIRRFFAPPPFPRLVGPGAAYWSKHIPSQNPRANVLHASSRPLIIHPSGAPFHPVHLLPCARREKPLE